MDAGRELDRLIAEQVMGLRPHKAERPEWVRGRDYVDPGDYYYIDGDPATGERVRVPEYSTDIAVAWEVVEFLNNRFEAHLELYQGRAFATFKPYHEPSGYGPDREKRGTTIPHAICLAALEATQQQEQQP